jgi:hypothetical protein
LQGQPRAALSIVYSSLIDNNLIKPSWNAENKKNINFWIW